MNGSAHIVHMLPLLMLWAFASLLLVAPTSALALGNVPGIHKRDGSGIDSSHELPHYETHDAAWAAIREAHANGNSVKAAYIKSTGTLISNIQFEEQKLSKRFDFGTIVNGAGSIVNGVGHAIKHVLPNIGKTIPWITFTEHQVVSQGTYFTAWQPASCPFYNDKSIGDVRHDFTTTITKSVMLTPGFDLDLAGKAALKIGAEITRLKTLTRLDSYTVHAGDNCQIWVRPLMLWQYQQSRQCKRTSLMTDDKTCTGWSASVRGDFLVQNKTVGNLRCGEANIRRNDCGEK